ncbi:MAG TPA: glycerol-3-phosphate 1-O-acyltransferase PlsY [Burkholderiales bacterium]|nr:glycerol-3-phosphate 1-O-acyltransferase PlsY [Burkholderiales bacterium]
MPAFAFIVAAYLIGSISFAVVVSRGFGLPDPHTYGSGNPGATNVLRSGSKAAAVLTLLGDAAKGAIALLLARWLAPGFGVGEAVLAGVGIAAFLGHLFPLYFHFKGGKGVATAAGILLALDLRVGGITLLAWLLTAIVTRYSSLAAIVAALIAPAAAFYFLGASPFMWMTLAMALLLLWRHRANFGRLVNGAESRIKLSRGG